MKEAAIHGCDGEHKETGCGAGGGPHGFSAKPFSATKWGEAIGDGSGEGGQGEEGEESGEGEDGEEGEEVEEGEEGEESGEGGEGARWMQLYARAYYKM